MAALFAGNTYAGALAGRELLAAPGRCKQRPSKRVWDGLGGRLDSPHETVYALVRFGIWRCFNRGALRLLGVDLLSQFQPASYGEGPE